MNWKNKYYININFNYLPSNFINQTRSNFIGSQPKTRSTLDRNDRRSLITMTDDIIDRETAWLDTVRNARTLSLFSLSRRESALRRRRIISVSRHGVTSHHIVSGSGCERMDSRYFCARGSSAGGLCGSSAVIPSRSPHLETLRFWRLTPYRSFLIPLLNAYTRTQQQFHRKSNRKKRLWYPR